MNRGSQILFLGIEREDQFKPSGIEEGRVLLSGIERVGLDFNPWVLKRASQVLLSRIEREGLRFNPKVLKRVGFYLRVLNRGSWF